MRFLSKSLITTGKYTWYWNMKNQVIKGQIEVDNLNKGKPYSACKNTAHSHNHSVLVA